MGFIITGFIILLAAFISGMVKLKKKQPSFALWQMPLILFYILSLGLFAFGLLLHDKAYSQAVDPIDGCYTPFSDRHIAVLLVYFVLYHIAMICIWIRGRKLPPLTLVLMLVLLFSGAIVDATVVLQVIGHDTRSIDAYKGNDGTFLFLPAPLLGLFIGILLTIKMVRQEQYLATGRDFKNRFLQQCNRILGQKYPAALWALILMLPVFALIMLVLILFGQDYDSLVKVFTDTTTWTFSQKRHPPPLDHTGHYLCTAAACGSPRLVKPLKIGKRHGRAIVVNRQLQIANAFEEMVRDISPRCHRFIRRNYDRYGYNLSVMINTRRASNLTYLLMKPLEILFLLTLYLLCMHPEQKIKRQYR